MSASLPYSADEIIVTAISRLIDDGEVVAQGIATPLVAAAYLLAKATHAPAITFISAIGQAYCRDAAPLGIATVERLWLARGLVSFGFAQAACDLLPRFGPKEFFRPGQVDPCGNFNNVYMGGSYDKPRLRLPGSGGIPDVTVFEENVYLYVPRHGRHTFVSRLDFRSGLGHDAARRAGHGPRGLISNLGQFDFVDAPGDREHGRLRLVSRHEGIPVRRLEAKTGFPLIIPPLVPETAPPSEEELQLLRQEVDPLGIRRLETLAGAARRRVLREILKQEVTHTRES